jgi:catechol 2,3-dioxygenase-like lactoylglutathione lyase family enzyme
MQIEKLDHVALWVSERDRIADAVGRSLGMHVIERTDAFALVGWDARRGKLTLFAGDGPREPGALRHIGLRLPGGGNGASRELTVPDGLVLRLAESPAGAGPDLDHVALVSRQPERTAEHYLALGFQPADPAPGGEPRVQVAGSFVEFHEGDPGEPDRPLLNHLAVLVPSADRQLAEAEEKGLEIADVVDAPNTKAVFVWGPERVKIEYVEHKASFSLV